MHDASLTLFGNRLSQERGVFFGGYRDMCVCE